ncbi:MAG: hypothetical protein IJ841_02250 [Prevotella sp.]|nr:hypothetical protein [Prevotella sp.]
MKKILSLLSLLMLCIVGTSAQTTLYSWESPGGVVAETGGTIAYVNGDGNRLNYKNGSYYTICLNGKKANINDADPSANAGKMVLTLDQPLATGDEIAFTAYITKNTSTSASPYVVFETGTTIDGPEFSDAENIDASFGGAPGTKIVEVPESANGSKTITLTRSKTGTNLFIIKLVITRQGSATPTSVDITIPSDIPFAEGYLRTFSSEYALDFSAVEGLTAYVGKQEVTDDWMSPTATFTVREVTQVPAGTGLLLKAAEAKTYTVPVIESAPAVTGNDLKVATERTDISTLQTIVYGSVSEGPAILEQKEHTYTDWDVTYSDVTETVTGFFPVPPAAAGEKFFEAGDVYLALSADEFYNIIYCSPDVLVIKGLGGGATEPAATLVNSIAELNAINKTGTVKLQLNNAKVSFSKKDATNSVDQVVIEDATGGIPVEGVAEYLNAGDVLSGTLTFNVKITSWFGVYDVKEVTISDDSSYDLMLAGYGLADNVTLTSGGTAQPFVLTDDNLSEYAESYNWRLVKFANATIGTQGAIDKYLHVDVLDDDISVQDLWYNTNYNELPADGSKVDAIGFLYYYDFAERNVFQPVSITEASEEPVATDVTIDMATAISEGDAYVKTFTSPQPLDFTGVEGIKAYIGKKNVGYSWETGDVSDLVLTPVDKVPANTGIIVKATAAQTYTIAIAEGEVAPIEGNDLVAVTEDTDLFPLVDGYNKSVATLQHKTIEGEDWWTGPFTIDATGFIPVDVPAEEGVNLLHAGDVYLPLDKDELSEVNNYTYYVKLVFTDAPVVAAENIAALKALPDGQATLKLNYTAQVTYVNESNILIEDYTGGLVLQGFDAQSLGIVEGSILSGEITGNFEQSTLFPVLTSSSVTDPSTLIVFDKYDVTPATVSLGEAFEEANLTKLVRLTDVTIHVTGSGWSKTYSIEQDGSEVDLNDFIYSAPAELEELEDGTQLEELTGFAVIIPQTSMYAGYFENLYNFNPISFKLKEVAPQPKPYEFVAAEWPAGDPGRISASNVTVDETANTITVNKDGNNNVALKFVSTNEYYVTPDLRYFTIRATGLSTEEGKSYLWWLNNANHGSQVAPSTIYEDGGVTVFAWDIRTCGLGDNFSSTENTTLQTTGDWITTFGMTLADQAVPAVISYIGFETTVPEPIKEYEYSFVATEWPAGDPGRISPSNVVVDEAANTITVDAKGQNNVALNFKTDRVLYVKPVVKYFVIQATGLSTTEGDSYLWWLNAKNNGGQVVPTYAVQKGDVVSLIWDITTDATFASGFNAEGNSYLDGTGASTWGWTTTFGLTLADQNVPAVISYIGYENEESELVKEALKEDPVEPTYSYPATWDFTQWSEATVSNLKADAAASIFTGWSDVEKNPATEGNPQEPTDATRDNCFWHQGQPDVYGQLYANGQLIDELKGLKFYDQYAGARSLAIAVNYPSTSLGDYAGASYLWLGGGGKSVPCFELPGVPAGMSITMEVESHKTTDARGVELYAGSIDAANKIGDSFKPTTKASYTWNVTEAANIVVYNTSGCHIYSIKVAPMVVDGIHSISLDATSGSTYDLQGRKVEQPRRGGLYIQNGKKVVVK